MTKLTDTSQADKESESSTSAKKDTTKYLFNDGLYGKGKLVLAVIGQYLKDNPDTTLSSFKAS